MYPSDRRSSEVVPATRRVEPSVDPRGLVARLGGVRAVRPRPAHAMAHRDTSLSELCRELGIRPVTLYTYVGPQGQLREQGQKVLVS